MSSSQKGEKEKQKGGWIKCTICLNPLEISSDQGEGDCNSGHECNSGGLFQGLYPSGQKQDSVVRAQVPDICWTLFILTSLALLCKLLQGHMHRCLPRGWGWVPLPASHPEESALGAALPKGVDKAMLQCCLLVETKAG